MEKGTNSEVIVQLLMHNSAAAMIAWLGSTHAEIGSYTSSVLVLMYAVMYWWWVNFGQAR